MGVRQRSPSEGARIPYDAGVSSRSSAPRHPADISDSHARHLAELRRLRDAYGAFATGVTIVTTTAPDGRRVGLTANSFSSVSLEPPLVLFNLSRRSTNLDVFLRSDHLAISVLALEQMELCERFSRTPGAERFDGVSVSEGLFGLPLIDGALAHFQCERWAAYDGGDHMILVARVLQFDQRNGTPLVFSHGRYAGVID